LLVLPVIHSPETPPGRLRPLIGRKSYSVEKVTLPYAISDARRSPALLLEVRLNLRCAPLGVSVFRGLPPALRLLRE
jgi:hypothetical protein